MGIKSLQAETASMMPNNFMFPADQMIQWLKTFKHTR
jgi:hypothetical protein